MARSNKVGIYLVKVIDSSEIAKEKKYETFIGSDGNKYPKLWFIERKVDIIGSVSVVTINGKSIVVDATVPTEVDKIPRGAKIISAITSEELWKQKSHYFGIADPDHL